MGFKSAYGAEQKAAVVAAIIDHGWTYKRALEGANRGELPGIGRHLEPFPVALGTVTEWGSKARQQQRADMLARAAPDAYYGALIDRLREPLERLVREAERKPTPELAARTYKAIEAAIVAERKLRAGATRSSSSGAEERPPAPGDFVDSLVNGHG